MKRLFLAVMLTATAGVAFAAQMKQAEAVVRLLNTRTSQGPKLYLAAAERVASDAKAGLPLQKFIMAVHPDLPEEVRPDDETRNEYLESSRPRIRLLAEQRGNPLALYLLALETDDAGLLEKAADGGNVQALNAWGTALLDRAQQEAAASRTNEAETVFAKAFKCFRSAASKKDPNGYYNLGMCYMQGVGGAVDESKAFECFRSAAEAGHPEAMNVYGMCYFSGVGVEKDPALAIAWFRRSAAEGFPPAMENLSDCYDRGVGVEASAVKSMIWRMRFRAATGDNAAAEWLESVPQKDE